MNSDLGNNYVLIMAGGVGSRFWPKSRTTFPKQFIDILGIGKSLLQMTYERSLAICPKENIYISSNIQYKQLIKDQLPDIRDSQILLEPSRNNTAPCIAYAAYKLAQINPDANMVIAPSDQLILKEDVYIDTIKKALAFTAEQNALVTLGIKATRPDTGYGYINFDTTHSNNDIFKVKGFKEKPDLQTAQTYLQSGNYLWNAGIFIWHTKSIIEAIKTYAPSLHDLFYTKAQKVYTTANEASFIAENYPTAPNISIDYAIMEHATNVYTIPSEIGWSDLGTWASFYNVANLDEQENAVSLKHQILIDTKRCVIQLPSDKSAVIKGLDNYIVVDDGKVLLIYPKSDEQEIKEVSNQMVTMFGESFK